MPVRANLLPKVLEAIAEHSKDPFFGLHAAVSAPRGFYGVLEYVGATAPTIRDSLEVLGRFAPLLSETLGLKWLEGNGKLVITLVSSAGPRTLGRHRAECSLALLLRFGRAFTGERIVPDAVWFGHPAPRTIEPLSDFFGTSALTFGASENGMVYPASVLDLPFQGHDPSLRAILEARALELARPRASQDFVARVGEVVRASLQRERGDVQRVAAALHMSGRTLQRRLVAEGTTFRQVLDGVRHALARAYLADPRLRGNLAEISFRLGYTTQASFGRAYRRWAGASPGRDARLLEAAGRRSRTGSSRRR